MRVITAFILIWLGFMGNLPAQSITISGRTIDKETKEPLPFASVIIKGKPISTITNLQGEFDFHIPLEYRNNILVIRMLGYVNFEAPVWTLGSFQPLILELTKSTTVLEEVVITDSLLGGELIGIALNHLKENFPINPFMMDGFYRDIKKVAHTYISILEAAVKIYDEDYVPPRNKSKLRERVRLIEVRKSLGYESRFTSYFNQNNLLEDLLLNNTIRYGHIQVTDEFRNYCKRERDSFFDGNRVFVISYKKDFYLKVFIDKVDYSIVHLEYEKPEDFDEVVDKKHGLRGHFAGLKKTIDFRRVDGRMYLSFMSMVSRVRWHDYGTNEFKFETELTQQFLVNQVTPNSTEKIQITQKMRNYGLQYQDQPYNKKFWDNYNLIKETPLDKKIIEDLERIGPLKKQFEGGY